MKILKILLTVFFFIAIVVHVIGLVRPFTEEAVWSHLVHIFSYAWCCLSMWRGGKWLLFTGVLAAVYPWCYHVNCFYQSICMGGFNFICFLVIVVMPLSVAITYFARPSKL